MEVEDRYQRPENSNFDCLLFDLDDTLYPLSSGISSEISKNIEDYMVEKLGIEESKASSVSKLLYKHYGTTMAGLRAIGYVFNHDNFHSIVHGKLNYEQLKPDPILKHLLQSLPIRKLVFTNGDELHASRVLARLGLNDCFEGIICFETLNPSPIGVSSPSENSEDSSVHIFDVLEHFSRQEPCDELLPKSPILCKPSEAAMERAFKIADIDPCRTMFFDDSVRNIQTGKRLGLHTVLVGTAHRVQDADHALESLHNLKEALPELWEEMAVEKEDAANIRRSGKVAIETLVIA